MGKSAIGPIRSNNPSKPLGAIYGKEVLMKVIELANKYKIKIIEDPAYSSLVYDDYKYYNISTLSQEMGIKNIDGILTAGSFSKSHSFSGLRLGYILCTDEKLMDRIKKFVLYCTNGINSLTQYAAITALQDYDYVEYMRKGYQKKRDILFEEINKLEYFSCDYMSGAFYCWMKVFEKFPINLISKELLKRKVGNIPGNFFGSDENYIRLAYSCPEYQIENAIKVLQELDKEMKKW